ncbi:MAG TPA: DUF2339 domain-containing protein [Devosia sp.]|nr:DUF2339 domain-containing protein [Devosia sp.]
MEWILLLGVLVAIVVLFVSNNRMRGEVDRLQQESRITNGNLERLEKLYAALLASRHAAPVAASPPVPLATEPPPAVSEAVSGEPMAPQPPSELEPQEPVEPAMAGVDIPTTDAPPPPDDANIVTPPPALASTKRRFEWERLIGVQLPIWLGALALGVAGFFFVSYAIESGFFSPEFRVIAALLAGFAFLGGAEAVRRRNVPNGANIAAALASAAIATFYATAYIASAVYHLVPESVGFVAMAAVTAAAIAIALVYGQAVALVGLLGGYVTPLFFSSEAPSAFMLFAYLALLHVAAFAVIRFKDWWNLSPVALAGPVLWVLAWTQFSNLSVEPWPLIVFLIIVPVVVAAASPAFWRDDAEPVRKGAGWIGQALPIALGIASIGFVWALYGSGYAMPFWQGLVALSLLTAFATFARPLAMGHRLAYPAVASVLALLAWRAPETTAIVGLTAVFAAIFVLTALAQFTRLARPVRWAALLASFVAAFFVVALFKIAGWETALSQRHFWAASALAIAVALIALLVWAGPRIADEVNKSRVYAILAGAVTTFVSLAVVLELDPVLFPAAAALAVLGLAAVHARVPVRGLRVLAAIYAVLYGLLVIGAGGGVATPGSGLEFVLAKSVPDSPWVLLVLPGLAFLGASTLFRLNAAPDRVDLLAECLDVAAVMLLAVGIVFVADPRIAFVPPSMAMVAGAKIAPFEALLIAGAVYLGRTMPGRGALYLAGLILAGIVSLAMLVATVAPVYTFWPVLEVPALGPFSVALAALGVPALVFVAVGWFVRQDADVRYANAGRALSVYAVFVLFTLMLVEIRRAFHPDRLQGVTGTMEFYTYSAGMLAFGVLLLVIGVVVQNRGARALSLVFVLAATVKVFLFDAASLEGLWRVLSFLGLGLSFLGISWAYARYVFGIGIGKPKLPDVGPQPPQGTAPPTT